jgi:3-hydroxyisobutyrate dehydrogenase
LRVETTEGRRDDRELAKVAWIGLGTMGGPMAARLVASGVQVMGVDLDQKARDRAASNGITVVGTIAEAVTRADAVVTILPAAPHVRSVLDGPDGIWAHAGSGALLVDASTVDIETSRWCHEHSTERNFRFVDAPVSGGVPGAVTGTLTAMLGGEKDAVKLTRELFAPMIRGAIDAGGPTCGVAAKICNNMMLFINLMSTCEGSQLAEHLGLEPKVFWQIASSSSGRSFPLETWFPSPGVVDTAPANRNFEPDFPAKLALKDVSIALAAGESTGVHLAAAKLVAEQFQSLIDEGLGDKDCSLVVKVASPNGEVRGFNER